MREEALFAARRQTLAEQTRLIEQQAQQADEEAVALRRQIAAESRALGLQREEPDANRRLMAQGFVGAMRVKTVDRAAADHEARISERQAELAKVWQRGSELALRVKTLENQFMQAAADELKESGNKLAFDLDERLRPSKDAAERQRIAAPIAGEVVDLKFTSLGAVVGPRDAILDLVPLDGKLIMEGRIRPEDINHVAVGSTADVRLTAFKSRLTPVVAGRVVTSRPTAWSSAPAERPYYTVHVDVAPEELQKAGNLRLQAECRWRCSSRPPSGQRCSTCSTRSPRLSGGRCGAVGKGWVRRVRASADPKRPAGLMAQPTLSLSATNTNTQPIKRQEEQTGLRSPRGVLKKRAQIVAMTGMAFQVVFISHAMFIAPSKIKSYDAKWNGVSKVAKTRGC